VQNRNFARGANLTNTNLRYGVELGTSGSNQFIQTQTASFSHTIYFPRFIPNFTKLIPEKLRDNFKTFFTFNAATTERRLLYNLATLNAAWGYEFQRRKKLLTIKLPNIEYSFLNQQDSLTKLILANPSLKNIFTDGFIASIIANFTVTGGTTNRLNIFRANMEESGLLTGLIRNNFLDKHLYRFVKVDAEFARLIRYSSSSIALRAFAGVGYEFNSTRNPDKRNNLPFFKEYFSGGPNSMRAWALRRLGPGSSVKEFNGSLGIPDRYGDVQLEANAEYRFPIGKPFGIKVNGAVFTDVGNVWFLKSAPNRSPEEVFNFSRLGEDIAIGSGAGLRIDFDIFVIRFDYGYRIKDPSPSLTNVQYQNKWFSYPFLKGSQFQIGIGYPFIF
jgi:outer membrane protein assembly factor BamA